MISIDAPPAPAEWVIPINPPAEYQGGTIAQLRLREPTMAELNKALGEIGAPARNTEQSRNQMQIVLVSLVSGVPRPVVEALPWSIVVGAANWLLDFTPKAPPTQEV
ncbi:MAG: hypothetical protein NVSMB20_10350 [Bradyrhizobium sp.]